MAVAGADAGAEGVSGDVKRCRRSAALGVSWTVFGRELDRFRIASVREHGAGGENLDVIGATVRKQPNFLPDFPRTVGLAVV